MPDNVATAGRVPPALTMLSEEEQMFRDTVRAFALQTIKPHVRQMDEKAEFRHELIEDFFRMGLMSIAVPEEYGGSGGTFFQTILAIEELSAVDPSAGGIVDVQNTLVPNAIMRW